MKTWAVHYDYRARGCNTYGCSAYTSALTEQVQIPAANPMTVPQHFLIKFPNAQVNDLQRLFWDPVTGASNYLVNVRNNSCSSDYQLLIPANDPQPSTITATIPTCNGSNPDLVTLFYSIKACNGSLCSEYSPTITVKVQRTAGLVPDSVATAPTTTYIHTDALLSPVAETNGTGTVTLRTRYEPYGKTLMPPVQGPGYAGHVVDVSTGLSYMQQRYYDPLAGRFLSADPVPASPASFNRYWYANNNPYKYIDPDGRCVDGPSCEGMAQYFGGHPDEARPLVPFAAAGAAVAAAPILMNAGMAALTNLPATINAVNAIAEIGAGDALGGASLTVGGTTLYRVVDDLELASVLKLGKFSPSPNGDTVKRFLDNSSDAEALAKKFGEFFGGGQHVVKGVATKDVMSSATKTQFKDVPGRQMESVNIPSRLVDKVICTGTHIKSGGC